MAFLIIIIIAVVTYVWLSSPKNSLTIPEIHKVNSIKDIVMSVNHGRIYPFNTRMNLIRAKEAAKKVCSDITEIESALQMQELMGIAPYFSIPICNDFIERISVHLNKRGLVSSIGVDIKNFDVNMKPLVEEMVVKFGRPTSIDNEFIIWREACMVINIHREGSLNIIDESLLGY